MEQGERARLEISRGGRQHMWARMRACSRGITKGHFEDHIRAMSVRNGLVLADLALGPGNGLGDLLSLLLLLQKKTHLNNTASLWIFSPSSPHCPSVPGNKTFIYTNVLSRAYCHSLHKKFVIYIKLTGP